MYCECVNISPDIWGQQCSLSIPHRVEAAVSGMFLKPRDCHVVEGGPELVQWGVSKMPTKNSGPENMHPKDFMQKKV